MFGKPLTRWVGFAVLLVGLVLIAACGAPQATAPAQGNTTTPAEITFALNEEPEELGAMQAVVSKFEAANPNIKVTLANTPDDEEFTKKLAADVAAKTPPDVILFNYRRLGPFVIKGAVQPVDGYFAASQSIKAADYYPTAMDSFKFKGQQMCVPLNLSQLHIYYNVDMFKAANVPLPTSDWTWADFLNAAKALTRDTNGDGKTDQFGVGIARQAIRLMPFIWAHGGDLVDNPARPTELTLDRGAALEAFQWFADLQVKEKVVPNKEEEATENSQTRFQNGTLGMFFQSRVLTPELRATIKDFQWDIAPLPMDKTKATILHSDGFCIMNDSKNKDAAWKFVEYIAGKEGQVALAETGRSVPALISVAESDAFLKSSPPANNRVLLDMAPYVRPVPLMTTWLEVESVVNQEMTRAFWGDVSVAEAAKTAVEHTREYFKQNLTDQGSP
jgi:multiple sugar transport system substrate-binding protein